MSRISQKHCDRCGATILGQHNVVKFVAGPLSVKYDGTQDYCEACSDRIDNVLSELLGGSRETAMDERPVRRSAEKPITIVAPTTEGIAGRQALRHGPVDN